MSEVVNVSLETGHVEAIASRYPEEMREPFVWLCAYVVQECNRSTDVLEVRVRELGFETTASTFDKILRGRWDTDSQGQKVSPAMAIKNFLTVVGKLRAQARISAMAGRVPFIKTPTATEIYSYIDVRRAEDRINKFGLISGPTGAQKTATFRQYCLENNHGACVWIESPARPSLAQFIIKLSEAYGASRNQTMPKRELIIREAVNAKRTIIVDNIQRLYRAQDGGNQVIFGWLQQLQDETRCTVILSATPDFKNTFTAGVDRGYFEQFVGRCGGRRQFLELPQFTPAEDILVIAQAFGLSEAEQHVEYLGGICRESGRVRVLFGDLQRAKQRAEKKKEPLNIGHVKFVRDEEEA